MKVLSVNRCVVISYVGRCCVGMEIYLLIAIKVITRSVLRNNFSKF
jgi:hypothetical protein